MDQNYPNPFNPSTGISYSLSRPGFVTQKLFDMLGREVRTLIHETKAAGRHSITFQANGLASGVYFYRLTPESGFSTTRKMLLLR